VTVAPKARSREARSLAREAGMNKTDCPIQTTPGRATYGTVAVPDLASERPKIKWATRTESDREDPSTSYERRTVDSTGPS